ncbi:MAG: hypothetical protein ACLFNB_02510 [Candidatus Woesearchaeota archaeon]
MVSVSFIILALALFLLTIVPAQAADQRYFVVANSKDWKDVYIASVYAALDEADHFYQFSDLSDAEMKTDMISKKDMVVVFESKNNPVIKDYQSTLGIKGYEYATSYEYSSLSQLQEIVHEQTDSEGVVVFGTDYGVEPIAAIPYLVKHSYTPLFYSNESVDFIQEQAKSNPSMFVGRIPVRDFEFDNARTVFGGPVQTAFDMTEKVIKEVPGEWGVMARIDKIDYQSLISGRPVFLHFSNNYVDEISQLAEKSGIRRYEIVGGDMVSIANNIESKAGEDFKFMLKYGRKVTNYDDISSDSILDIDSVELPRPIEHLKITNATYYPAMNKLGVTYQNDGNIDLLFYSNLEFGDDSFSDTHAHHISAGEERTYSYDVEASENIPEKTVITSRYAHDRPLSLNVEDNGSQIIQRHVDINENEQNKSLWAEQEGFRTETGDLYITVHNNATKKLNYFVEVLIGNESVTYSTKKSQIEPESDETVVLSFPYIPNEEILNKTADVKVQYGVGKTVLDSEATFTIKQLNTSQPLPVAVIVTVMLIVLALLIIIGAHKKKARSMPEKGVDKTISKQVNKKPSGKTVKKKTASSSSKKSPTKKTTTRKRSKKTSSTKK